MSCRIAYDKRPFCHIGKVRRQPGDVFVDVVTSIILNFVDFWSYQNKGKGLMKGLEVEHLFVNLTD